jgi:hypothetical protein
VSHRAHEGQVYISDEDDIDQVKEEGDGIMALGRGRTRLYMGDEVASVK